jgi:tetratricopeptide (TPR) repeat protein
VYGLGAVLYHLLAGRPPFQGTTAIETLLLVRQAEPVRPSLLNPRVDSDLETVCLKCLEKDPRTRYPSAAAVAEELERFLRGEPVRTRPVSRPERLRRWARRNPLPAALAAVLTLAVITGLTAVLALWGNAERHWHQEEAARREAEDNFLACRQVLAEYVALTRDPRPQTVAARHEQRAALAKARAFCEGLTRQRPDDPGLRRDLAEVCTGLAALHAHDGRLDEAREAGETAHALWQRLLDVAPDDPRCRERLADLLSTLGFVYSRLARTAEAVDSLRQAINLGDRLADAGEAPVRLLIAASGARRALAAVMFSQGRQDETRRLYEEGSSRLESAAAEADAPPELRLELLVVLTHLGDEYQHDGNHAAAARCWRRGYELGRQLTEEAPDNAPAVFRLAVCGRELASKDRAAAPPEETARLCEQARRLLVAQRRRDPADQDTTQALVNVCWMLSDSYRQAGKHADALQASSQAVAAFADLSDRHADDLIARLEMFEGQAMLAVRQRQCCDPSAARATARQAADGFEQFSAAHAADRAAVALLARFDHARLTGPLRQAGAADESLRVAERCRRLFEDWTSQCPDEPRYWSGLSQAWTQIGKVHWAQGQGAETEAALRAAVKAADELARRCPEYRPLCQDRLSRLGRFLEEHGRHQ